MKTAKEILSKYTRTNLSGTEYFSTENGLKAMEEYASQLTSPVAQPVTDEKIENVLNSFLGDINNSHANKHGDITKHYAKLLQFPQPTKIDWEEVENKFIQESIRFGNIATRKEFVLHLKEIFPNSIQNNGYTREQIINFALEAIARHDELVKMISTNGKMFHLDNKLVTIDELYDEILTSLTEGHNRKEEGK